MPAAHAPQRDALRHTARTFAALIVVALLGATACASDDPGPAVITDPPTPTPLSGPQLESDSVPDALLAIDNIDGGWTDREPRHESFAKCIPLIEQFSKVAISGRAKARYTTDRTYLEEIIASFSNRIVAASFMNDVFDIIPDKCKYQRVVSNIWRSVKSAEFPVVGDESFGFNESIARGSRDPFIEGRWFVFRRANAVVLLAHEWYITDKQSEETTMALVRAADDKLRSKVVEPATAPPAPPSPSSAPQP